MTYSWNQQPWLAASILELIPGATVEDRLLLLKLNLATLRGIYRSDFLITSFNPDQTASTAQTLISTRPRGRAAFRTTSSVRSVCTPEDFFGQETQIAPGGVSSFLSRAK